MNDNKRKPTIVVSMRRNRIRLHRSTLAALGNPDYIILIINPEEKSLGIKSCSKGTVLAHHINPLPTNRRLNCELYSKSLIRALKNLCPYLETGNNWEFQGTVIAEENMAVYPLSRPENYPEM